MSSAKKVFIDITIIISCITGMVLSYVYLDNSIEKNVSLTTLGIVSVFFLGLAMTDSVKTGHAERRGYHTGRTGISEILLLGEDSNITDTWDNSSGSWYIEDLDSENGTRIQRNGEDKPYRVSSREPCKVEKGDVIYLGLAPLKVR